MNQTTLYQPSASSENDIKIRIDAAFDQYNQLDRAYFTQEDDWLLDEASRKLIQSGKEQAEASLSAFIAIIDDIYKKIDHDFVRGSSRPKPQPIADWLWRGWIRAGVPACIAAHGESGKGLFCEGLALSVASGRDYMHYPTKQGKVIFISSEDDLEELESRMHDIREAGGFPISCLENIYHMSTADAGLPSPLLDDKLKPTKLLLKIKKAVERIKPVLVVLDTLAGMGPGGKDLTQSGVATVYITSVSMHLKGPTLLFTHHLRKPGGDFISRPGSHDVRDSSAIVGSLRSVLILYKNGLSLDKCNGRRRVESKYRVNKDVVMPLFWQAAEGCGNGMLNAHHDRFKNCAYLQTTESWLDSIKTKEREEEGQKIKEMMAEMAENQGQGGSNDFFTT